MNSSSEVEIIFDREEKVQEIEEKKEDMVETRIVFSREDEKSDLLEEQDRLEKLIKLSNAQLIIVKNKIRNLTSGKKVKRGVYECKSGVSPKCYGKMIDPLYNLYKSRILCQKCSYAIEKGRKISKCD